MTPANTLARTSSRNCSMSATSFRRLAHSGNLAANIEKGNADYHEPRPYFRMAGAFALTGIFFRIRKG